ncbi:MAG TPA: MFS transporter [Paraburkholderia sp.]|jgi:MFS family permease
MLRPGSVPSLVLLFLYGMAATSLVTQSVPVIGDIAHHFGLPHATAGWVISLPSLITALGSLFGGWLVDRIGDKKVIVAGTLFGLAGNLVVFWSHDVTTLLAGRLLEGFAYLALTVGALTLIMRTTTGVRRSVALGLWTAHTAVGIGLTLSIVAPLAQHGELWRWAFGGHALLMVLLLVCTTLLPGRSEQQQQAMRRLVDIWSVLKCGRAYRVALAAGASAFIQTGVMAALTVYMSHTFGVSVSAAAGIGTLAEVFVVLACLGVGHLLKKRWSIRLMSVAGSGLTLAAGIALYMPGVTFAGAAIAICVFSVGIGGVNALIWTLIPRVAPNAATLGATGGLVSQASYIGVLLGPPAIFTSFQTGGWTLRITLIALAAFLQVAAMPIWRKVPQAEPVVSV